METILFIGWLFLGIFFPFIINRKRRNLLFSIRFITLYTTVYLLGMNFFIWLGIKENNLLLFSIVLSLIGGLIILSWPWTSPKFVKKYNLKW
jgi:hypothetical protein